MGWRWWLSAIVIALLVTAATMCIRTMWMSDLVDYSRGPVSRLSSDGTRQLWQSDHLVLVSSCGQLTWSRMTLDQDVTVVAQSLSFSAMTISRPSDTWEWIDIRNATRWELMGFGVRAGSAPFRYFSVSVPYWAVIGALATTLVLLIRSGRRERRSRRGLCPKCAYDIQGAFEKGCPECGWNRSEVLPTA